jgi:TRAP-type mannitol/chloroaromatic compound transport system substrate-binding protein
MVSCLVLRILLQEFLNFIMLALTMMFLSSKGGINMKCRGRKIFTVSVVLALLTGLFVLPGIVSAEQKTIRLQIQTPYPTSLPFVKRVADMWDRIKVMTDGKVNASFYPPGGIVPAYSEWDAMQKGTLDGAFTVPSDVRGIFGAPADLFNQYAGGPTADEAMSWVYFGNGRKLLEELLNKKGFTNVQPIGIANMSLAEDELWTNKKIEKPEDYKGLKVRTYGQWGKVLEDVGASVVTLPGGEVYQALERGVIDAAELGTSADNESLHMNEVAKYCYYPGVHSPGNIHYILFNKKSWAEIPDAHQKIIEREILATALENWLAGASESAAARKRMQAKGTIFLELPQAVQQYLVGACDKMWEGFAAKDTFYAKVYKDQLAFLASYRALIGQIQPNIAGIRASMK